VMAHGDRRDVAVMTFQRADDGLVLLHRLHQAVLIGLNGAGKSTIMKAACGLLALKTGRIVFDGKDITGIRPHELIGLGMGFIPQESNLFPHIGVRDNLTIPLRRRQQLAGANGAGRDRWTAMLEHFPLVQTRLDSKAGALSGGQQKQVEFAKAYLLRPKLCMIDEPSIGLSPKIAEQVFDWIGLFARDGMAILLVDHNIRKVIELSDYTYVLSLGEVTGEGPREHFMGDPHAQVKTWLGLNY
ncbi:ABC transporter ATP-binding protein, partial [Azospirillum sp.]|uniref:ABC transporter ATP-binding protein n=1 Tax=Azospirillum sp. TaxID=34012 RepID=UPI003D751CF3